MNTETRQKVLDAALQAILESSYQANFNDIAERVEASGGTIYRHFDVKDALFAESAIV